MFQERYGENWSDRIEANPHIGDQLLDLCRCELLTRIYFKQMSDLRAEGGEAALQVEAKNGMLGDHPCVKNYNRLGLRAKQLSKMLNINLERQDRQQTQKNKFMQLIEDKGPRKVEKVKPKKGRKKK